MNTTQLSAGTTVILAVYGIIWVVANWKLYTKANEAGWKSLIPFYNIYTLYKFTWKTAMFWIFLAGTLLGAIGSYILTGSAIGSILSTIGVLVVAVIRFLQSKNESKAFGKGMGFALGLFFLNPIFVMILAFGSAQYKGAQA